MLFRRFSQHIADQNWFAVGVDFLIVVFGVFIGFQADNWNEARKDRIAEREFLSRLKDDIAGSIEQTRGNLDFMSLHAQRGGIVLRALDECKISEAERDDFANGLYHLGKIDTAYMVRGTIDEMRSTGAFDLLRDRDIRDGLNDLIAAYEDAISVMSMVEDRIAPHVTYVDSRVF